MLALQLKHQCRCRSPRILHIALTRRRLRHDDRSRDPQVGLATPLPDGAPKRASPSPYYFAAGYAGWAKRLTRPFPPPFFSPPSGSFSDPLSTHNRSQDRRRPKVNGEIIRGVTVGDDAVLVSDNLIGANDGVGAWAQREKGCAPLWSRLILHFCALAAEKDGHGGEDSDGEGDQLVRYMGDAYKQTKEALSDPNEWLGTTTSSLALLHYLKEKGKTRPVVFVAQLGTNSPDTPEENAVLSKVDVEEDDIVLAMTDGVTDNLWEEEISETAINALHEWHDKMDKDDNISEELLAEGMRYVAQEIVLAARKIAEDPFAGSPFMERAVEEGLAIEGGKLDDISVVAAVCKKRQG
ncbi:hypothetical protein LTR97_008706 [Elasticomyces elasticus]|uniref:Protein phosphatase n=1 Tax=Elasticomyces elasticus TaxID=574655 RepID=A0AAN7W2T7_9PEZI|nr:hypothetical protein LTR97_008706 [Elasticomyces elasticus]